MSSKGTHINAPAINPKLNYGEIVSWDFHPGITTDHGKYCIRFSLLFSNGKTENLQKGRFTTKREAEKAKEILIGNLFNHQFIPFDFTVKEFYDYWLYDYMIKEREISYNTFMSYRNYVYNYLIPVWKESRKIRTIDNIDIVKAVERVDSLSKRNCICGVINSSFLYAYTNNIISVNPALFATQQIRKQIHSQKKKQKKETLNKPNEYPVLNAEQVAFLLQICQPKSRSGESFCKFDIG